MSLIKSIIRHALGLEGYIGVCTFLILSGLSDLLVPAAWSYVGLFLVLFVIKLSKHLVK